MKNDLQSNGHKFEFINPKTSNELILLFQALSLPIKVTL